MVVHMSVLLNPMQILVNNFTGVHSRENQQNPDSPKSGSPLGVYMLGQHNLERLLHMSQILLCFAPLSPIGLDCHQECTILVRSGLHQSMGLQFPVDQSSVYQHSSPFAG
jgi:hypothetical protein